MLSDLQDRNDIKTLIEKLGVRGEEQVIEIVKHYYPHKEVRPRKIFVLENFLVEYEKMTAP